MCGESWYSAGSLAAVGRRAQRHRKNMQTKNFLKEKSDFSDLTV
jgi:hypothetical protein